MARPNILVFQHAPYEPLGTLDPLLRQAGFRLRYVNFGRNPHERPSLEGYVALIILGGPMNADDFTCYPHLASEIELIQEALQRDISIMGICLGAQLLAKALGGTILAGTGREIGWHHVEVTDAGIHDQVLSSFGRCSEVFQWHDDVIELPPDAVHLARSERWLRVPQNQAVFADGQLDPNHIRARISDAIQPLMTLSNNTFSRWIERFDLQPRKLQLPSR